MSIKRTPALLFFLVALLVATLMVPPQSQDYIAVAVPAPTIAPEPNVQSSETMGLAGQCLGGLGLVEIGGGCGEKNYSTPCHYSQETCQRGPNGDQGVCVPAEFDVPDGTQCNAGAYCQKPSLCQAGKCVAGAIVDCSSKNWIDGGVVCEKWACSAQPGGECERIEVSAPINATCSMVTVPNPPTCGQPYIEDYSTITPAKCGGASCPADRQLMGPACPKVDCEVSGWIDPPNKPTCGTYTQTRTIIKQPAYGGLACPALSQTVDLGPCAVDCVVSAWIDPSPLPTCGSYTRTRTIIQQPLNGGLACPALTETVTLQGCPVDCIMGDWQDPFPKPTCGSYTQTRAIVRQASNGGLACGATSRTVTLATCPKCSCGYDMPAVLAGTSDLEPTCWNICVNAGAPRATSTWVTGAGGVREAKCWCRDWERAPCPLTVSSSYYFTTQTYNKRIVDAPYVGVFSSPDVCIPSNAPAPVDCVMSAWVYPSPLPLCGTVVRTRTVLVEPANGGQICGPTWELFSVGVCAPLAATCSGSYHERNYGANDPIPTVTCLNSDGVNINSQMSSLGSFKPGPGPSAPAGVTYDVLFSTLPTADGYTITTAPAKIKVNAVSSPCTIAPSNVTFGKAITEGILNASGAGTFTYKYKPADSILAPISLAVDGTVKPAVGTYSVEATLTPSDPNLAKSTCTGSFTVNQADSTCSLTGLTGQTVTKGTSVTFGAKGFLGGSTVASNGQWDFKEAGVAAVDGSTTFAVGSHVITATFTPSNLGYKPSQCSGSFSVTNPVSKYTMCTVSVSSMTYGTPLQVSAKAADGSFNAVDGVFTYTVNGKAVKPGDIIDAGTDYKIIATFTPTSPDYSLATCYSMFSVSKQTVVCTAGSGVRDYNTTLATAPAISCTLNGVAIQSGISGGALSAPPALDAVPKDYPITFTSVPTATNYNISTVDGNVTVKQVPTRCELTGLSGQIVTYGTTVTTGPKAYLGTTSNVITGTFLFKDGSTDLPSGTSDFTAGTVLPVGTHTITATFQPTNGSGYASSQCSGQVTVSGCTISTQCKVDDGNGCTDNACCVSSGGCTVGTKVIPKGDCYNKPVTSPRGALTPTIQVTCPTSNATKGEVKLTWPDNAVCVDSSYIYTILASNMSAPTFYSAPPGPSDVLATTASRSSTCTATGCSYTGAAESSKFVSGQTIFAMVAIGQNGGYDTAGNVQQVSTCAWCGDGKINGTDQCDTKAFPSGKTPPVYRCNSSCKLEWCGDGIRNGLEECDSPTSCTADCKSLGKATSCQVAPTATNYGKGATFNGVGYVGGTTTPLAGSWVYTLTATGVSAFTAKDGDILDAKTYSVSAQFLPSDTTFAASTCTGSLVVSPVAATCTGQKATREYKTPNPPLTYECLSGGVNINGKLTLGTFKSTDYPTLTSPARTSPYPVTFETKPTGGNYTITYDNASITITPAKSSCTISSPVITAGQAITYAMFNPVKVPDGTLTFTNTTTGAALGDNSTPPAGVYSIKASLAPTDSVNYTASECLGTLTVNKAVTCSTVPLKLPTSKTFDSTLVTSGFTITADVKLGGGWTFTIGGAPINYAQRPTGQITVEGTFQPTNGGYSTVTCSTTITPVQCTLATVAADCTADDGNACTDNACSLMGLCYNKYKGVSTTALSPTMTLTCSNTLKIEFNDVLACVDPTDGTAMYRIGVDSTNTLSWPGSPGGLVSMNSATVPPRCAGGKCSYTTTAINSTNFLSGKTLYGMVASFAAGALSKQESVSQGGTCAVPCTVVDCAVGSVWDSVSCSCKVTCGNGKIDPGEECDGAVLPAGAPAGSTCTSGCHLNAPAGSSCKDVYNTKPGYATYTEGYGPTSESATIACSKASTKLQTKLDSLGLVGMVVVKDVPDDWYQWNSTLRIDQIGCSATACVYTAPVTTTCGNGKIDSGEECDGSVDSSCAGLGCSCQGCKYSCPESANGSCTTWVWFEKDYNLSCAPGTSTTQTMHTQWGEDLVTITIPERTSGNGTIEWYTGTSGTCCPSSGATTTKVTVPCGGQANVNISSMCAKNTGSFTFCHQFSDIEVFSIPETKAPWIWGQPWVPTEQVYPICATAN